MKLFKFSTIIFLTLLISCSNNATLLVKLQSVSDTIKAQYAPDKRVALFDINFEHAGNAIIRYRIYK
jgi:hypothetical protein